MPSYVKARRWHTAKNLHQIQLLSCDFSVLEMWESPNHAAPFWRLYWHDGPGAEITVRGVTTPLNSTKIALIPANTNFASRNAAVVGQFFLHFLLEPGFNGPVDKVYIYCPPKRQIEACRELTALLKRDADSIRASLLAQVVIATALQQIPEEDWKERFSDARVTAAVATIKSRYPEKVDNHRLARNASLHPNAFIRLFRQSTGRTPVEYLIDLRLEEACTLLHFSETSMEEIAEKTGFCDRAYFSRVFKAKLNTSPALYRKQVNSNNRLRR